MLQIKHGSIFDDKCDLLILPCDSGGGVTAWVREEILSNELPYMAVKIPFGEVFFKAVGSGYTKSEYVGFAASVNAETTSSNLASISKILASVIEYCQETKCTKVNLPLLGTGAGGLDVSDVVSLYQRELSDGNCTFVAYIPDFSIARMFAKLFGPKPNRLPPQVDHPRVFISYSWKDEKIKEWAFRLAGHLCKNGVNARLDRFHLKPGMDMPQWMTNEIIKADKVLLICDEHYAEKADIRKAGVGWETMIIQGDMLLHAEMNSKYIAIACGDFDKSIPIYMKSRLGVDKSDIDKNIDTLLGHIFELDSAPEIGPIPAWIQEKRNATIL